MSTGNGNSPDPDLLINGVVTNRHKRIELVDDQGSPSAEEMQVYQYRICGYSVDSIYRSKTIAPGWSRAHINKTIKRVEAWLREQRKEELISAEERNTSLLESLLQKCLENFDLSEQDLVEEIRVYDSDEQLVSRNVKTTKRVGDKGWIKLVLDITDRLSVAYSKAVPAEDDGLFPSAIGRSRDDTIKEFYLRLKKKIEKQEEARKAD